MDRWFQTLVVNWPTCWSTSHQPVVAQHWTAAQNLSWCLLQLTVNCCSWTILHLLILLPALIWHIAVATTVSFSGNNTDTDDYPSVSDIDAREAQQPAASCSSYTAAPDPDRYVQLNFYNMSTALYERPITMDRKDITLVNLAAFFNVSPPMHALYYHQLNTVYSVVPPRSYLYWLTFFIFK